MNLNRKFSAILTIFVGLVLFGILSLAGGRRDSESYPSSEHYGPSGLRALSELLTQEGYRIRIDRRSKPKFAKGDTVVAVLRNSSTENTAAEYERNERIIQALADHSERGGNSLVGYLPSRFKDSSKSAAKTPVSNPFQSLKKVMWVPEVTDLGLTNSNPTLPIWNGRWNATAEVYSAGVIVTLSNALPLTNRFLDREQNADVVLNTIRTVTKPGSTIVFAEGGFEPVDPGFLGTIGPGAVAAWYQTLFVFAVIAYFGGKRLGLPDFRRIPQRSSRDLLDAMADTMQRSKSSRTAVRIAVSNAETWLDLWQIQNRTQETPRSLGTAIARGRAALMEKKLPAPLAVTIVKDLDREIVALRQPNTPKIP